MWRPCFIEMFMPMMDLLVTAGISLTPDFGPTLQYGVPTVQPDRRWRGWPWLPWSRGALGHWQAFGGIHPMFVIERPGFTTQESQWPTPRMWLGFWKPSWLSRIKSWPRLGQEGFEANIYGLILNLRCKFSFKWIYLKTSVSTLIIWNIFYYY